MNHTNPLRLLISQDEIQKRISILAEEISQEFAGRDITLLGIMTGSLFFLTDLMRQLSIPHQVGIIQASSYAGGATEPGKLRVNLDYLPNLQGREILLIDDILDTGQTLDHLRQELAERYSQQIRSAVLLWKKSRTQNGIQPDYFGFEIEDEFVVGYGLDYADNYRHLPDIHILKIS